MYPYKQCKAQKCNKKSHKRARARVHKHKHTHTRERARGHTPPKFKYHLIEKSSLFHLVLEL